MIPALVFTALVAGQDRHTYRDMSIDLNQLTHNVNPMAAVVDRFSTDRRDLDRLLEVEVSPKTFAGLKSFYNDWLGALATLDFDSFSLDAKVDYVLLRNRIEFDLARLDVKLKRLERASGFLPDLEPIIDLAEAKRQMTNVESEKSAKILTELAKTIKAKQKELPAPAKTEDEPNARYASEVVRDLDAVLKEWYEFYAGYDPMFSWWCKKPYEEANEALDAYRKHLTEKVAKVDDDEIPGDPVGREALLIDLKHELITYTPEELIEIAEKEFAWCEKEMLKASEELGFGNDWKAALEHVKGLHEEPGGQPAMIRELAWEAIAYLEDNDLMTIPDLAKRVWRMEMMSPERQKVSPFFLGGPTILVSFPTDTMTHEEKAMSMRGNNRHFAKATVHHELIPGHHMQFFMNNRYQTHRRAFGTPFWTEGWALWWEFLLYERGFPGSAESRVGFLFWRMHRCARIMFSLRYHLGEMTTLECVDFLVDKVGHERANAEGEVRRSFNGSYPPLYQLAYMTGALQLRALYADLVRSGKMTDKQFHDKIITSNSMPIEALRMLLTETAPSKDYTTNWRFYIEP